MTIAPKIVVIDISCESHEEIIECIDDYDYAVRQYGSDPDSYAIYKLVEE
jgi:hypothetical protein